MPVPPASALQPTLPLAEAAGSFAAPALFTVAYLLCRRWRIQARNNRHEDFSERLTLVSQANEESSHASPGETICGSSSESEESEHSDPSIPLLRQAVERNVIEIEGVSECNCDRMDENINFQFISRVLNAERMGPSPPTRRPSAIFWATLMIFLTNCTLSAVSAVMLLYPHFVLGAEVVKECTSSLKMNFLAASRAGNTVLWLYYGLIIFGYRKIHISWQLPGFLLTSIAYDSMTVLSFTIIRLSSSSAATLSRKKIFNDADPIANCLSAVFEKILLPDTVFRILLATIAFTIICRHYGAVHAKNTLQSNSSSFPRTISQACPLHSQRFPAQSGNLVSAESTQRAPTTLAAMARQIWPRKSIYLQLHALLCVLILVLGRLVGVALPYLYKLLIDQLFAAHPDKEHQTQQNPQDGPQNFFPFSFSISTFLFFGYFGMRLMNGGAGLINSLLGELWLPLAQHFTTEISLLVFGHLHKLSHKFHLSRNKAEILRIQERGVVSIVALANAIVFNVGPTLADILLAIIFFVAIFDATFGLLVLVTMMAYLAITMHMTRVQQRHRRRANALENAMEAVAAETLANFETVKLFTAEQFETQRFGRSIAAYHDAERTSSRTSVLLSTIQNGIIHAGMMVGAAICLSRIQDEKMAVSDFVMFLTYITQLYAPLNTFGSHYRQMQKNLVDMEKMLLLLSERSEFDNSLMPPRVTFSSTQVPASTSFLPPASLQTSSPTSVTAAEMPLSGNLESAVPPSIEFRNVCFSYDGRRQTLRNLTFYVAPATTAAIVGPSGAGKSTIMRLLLRFYEAQQGGILVDNVDVRDWGVHALRECIGVVPQDTVLFNESIAYNVAYGSPRHATRAPAQMLAAVREACRLAQIDDRVSAFPDKYETVVGDRGMRLSGGEKQRVGIARMLIKKPRILFLDEATSSLDTHTERSLQTELRRISEGRTSIVIAHRLSSIVHADIIYVVKDGAVVESGSHAQLMSNTVSVYYDMWMQQQEQQEQQHE